MNKKEIMAIGAFLFLVAAIGLFYFNASITGAAVASPQESRNVYGIYSVRPSFRLSIDYDFEDYAKIAEGVRHLSECTEEGFALQDCLKSLGNTIYYAGYEWEEECDKGAEKVFYDFAEFYQSCFDSEDDKCICELDLGYSEEEIRKLGFEGKYKIITEQNIPKTAITLKLKEPDMPLEYEIKTHGISNWNPSEYSVEYKEGGLGSMELYFRDELGGKDTSIKNIDKIALYKEGNSIEFARIDGDEIVLRDKRKEKPKTCLPKESTLHRFCVTNTNKKFYIFENNKAELKSPVIKFAAYIRDIPPMPLRNVEVTDKLMDDGAVIIKWDKGNERDIAKYNIYYAKSELNLFDDSPLEGIKARQGMNKKELDEINIKPITVDDLFLEGCEFDLSRKGCVYTTGTENKIVLEKEKLYLFEDPLKEYYIYALPLEDNVEYDFAVTAVDANGNEIDNVKYKLPVVRKKKSINDLPPSSKDAAINVEPSADRFIFHYNKEHLNLDGTPADDFSHYEVYYRFYQFNEWIESAIENGEVQEELLDKPLSEFSKYDTRLGILRNPDDFFIFAVIAVDKNNNPDANKFTPRQLGINSLWVCRQDVCKQTP
jgi:hypothetical protein